MDLLPDIGRSVGKHEPPRRESPDPWSFVSSVREEVVLAELGRSDPLLGAQAKAPVGAQRGLCGLFPDAAQTFV